MSLSSKNILLGVTGGIAAYKACLLVRLLTAQGHQVQAVMTAEAKHFVGAATFQALTGKPVRDDLWDEAAEAAMGHIELARWADVVVVVPATANTLAKMVAGMANDLLTTLCLATDAPVLVAPAMNRLMWSNAATQSNINMLKARGVTVVGPASGEQACGEVGAGRMSEPETLVEAISTLLASVDSPKLLHGKRVLLTAGPTCEDIDPVRFVSNRSSGKMGYALAEQAARLGAEVVLVSGPTQLPDPQGCTTLRVRSATQMHDAVMQVFESDDTVDVFVGVAAVADYTPVAVLDQKYKKSDGDWSIALTRTPDILASVAALPNKPFVVGFAAETQRVAEQAQAKRIRKGADVIAANQVGQHLAFGTEDNALDVFWDDGSAQIKRAAKPQVAAQLWRLIIDRMDA